MALASSFAFSSAFFYGAAERRNPPGRPHGREQAQAFVLLPSGKEDSEMEKFISFINLLGSLASIAGLLYTIYYDKKN